MSKKKHKFRGFAAMALLAGGIALVKTSGCSFLDITKIIETVTPDTPTPTPSSRADRERIQQDMTIEERTEWVTENVGEADQVLVFAPGEHVIHVQLYYPTQEELLYYWLHHGMPVYYDICTVINYEPDGHVTFDIHNCVEIWAQADENGQFLSFGAPTHVED